MEDLLSIFKKVEDLGERLDGEGDECLAKIRKILHGTAAALPAATATALEVEQSNCLSPQQTKKRPKRLSSLNEEDEPTQQRESNVVHSNTRTSNAKLLETVDAMEQDASEAAVLVLKPEPVAAPRTIVTLDATTQGASEEASNTITTTPAVEEHAFLRPQRAAKLKCEKNLKEVPLNIKMRRPSNMDDTLSSGVQIKLEHEQRSSQMHNASSASMHSKKSNASIKSNDDASLVIVLGKAPTLVDLEIDSEDDKQLEPTKANKISEVRVKVKREKLSSSSGEVPASHANDPTTVESALMVPLPKKAVKAERVVDQEPKQQSDVTVNTSSSTTNTTTAVPPTKKGKKKKGVPHRPIKVERFSEVFANPSPISSRTRQGSVGRAERQASVYEDAVEELPATEKLSEFTENASTPPTRYSQIPKDVATVAGVNETITIAPANATIVLATNDVTFQVDAATVTLNKDAIPGCDATFNVSQERQQANSNRRSPSKDNHSMVTARNTSKDDSLITEDESFEPPGIVKLPPPATTKVHTSAKAYKMPARTHELFNPLVQSPVKKKVEAFEELGKPGRQKRTKENAMSASTQSSHITPVIGKLTGRFLTPTQTSNITPFATAQTKKLASSASKAVPFPKTTVGSNLKSSASSAKASALSRENSGEDFRRLAEERRQQREQKHLLAAQQRNAKEKERAERIAKLAKEREEKRLKKQMEQEQKKKQLDDIQRKLKEQQETDLLKKAQAQARAAASKTVQEQERELLQQMKPPKSKKPVPLPPKFDTKYTFEMLHEDDSTDDEEKITYKRPAPPTWSRSHVRGPSINMQQLWPTDIIDSFFSVQPMTPDLKLIFPNIDARHLKRNSSVFWSTPPRYSELPKY